MYSSSWLSKTHSLLIRHLSKGFSFQFPSNPTHWFIDSLVFFQFMYQRSQGYYTISAKNIKCINHFFTTNRRQIFNFAKLKFFLHDCFSNLPSFGGLAIKICQVFHRSKIKNLFRIKRSIFSFSTASLKIFSANVQQFWRFIFINQIRWIKKSKTE